MQNSLLQFRNLPSLFSVFGKIIVSGVMLGLVSTLGTTVSAKPVTAPLLAQASATNNVSKRLVGRWEGPAPIGPSGTMIIFQFTPDGKLLVYPTTAGPSRAQHFQYRVNATPKPMHLDLVNNKNQTALTIFEFLQDGRLRLQLSGADVGKPRPSSFGPNATVFKKVS